MPQPLSQVEAVSNISDASDVSDTKIDASGGFTGAVREKMRVFIPMKMSGLIALLITVVGLGGGAWIGFAVEPQWDVQRTAIDVQRDETGLYFSEGGVRHAIDAAIKAGEVPTMLPQDLDGRVVIEGQGRYSTVTATKHLGIWSLLPAVVAIGLCLTIREPMMSLVLGIISGAFALGQYDITEEVLMPSLMSASAAGVLLLYLWLLGGLMGIWSRTGAARAFADWATSTLVRGPRSARLVSWAMGVLFFQGGSISAVLVGTSVKPIADKERISHEELSYIVDSTASPVAILLAFNAWPLYVQALIYVPGVPALATVQDRLSFFFQSLPLSFYAWFAVAGTLLLSIDKAPFLGKQMREAIRRARTTGELDRPGSEPLTASELEQSDVPEGYKPSLWDFALPLAVLIGVAMGTFMVSGAPQVRWAFGLALVVAAVMALVRGMRLADLMTGITNGLKGVVLASIILLLAVTLGSVTQQAGGGVYLVNILSDTVAYWALPAALMVLTMGIAFATGTSWGTFAVAFPLAMPLAAAIGQSQGLDRPLLYLMVCFAAVLNGSVYGDQCSPISDTTILSSMTTGCDLIDHTKTQLVPATVAAGLAIVCWEVVVLVFC